MPKVIPLYTSFEILVQKKRIITEIIKKHMTTTITLDDSDYDFITLIFSIMIIITTNLSLFTNDYNCNWPLKPLVISPINQD
jgi:hypothetical protein